ncbi:hypothetical protein BMS3Abin07_01124 [bacterium BMS3Abin07]|nr:hypothetical protein BMS3Abin07_01124 [bacterium BMS3Abin07]
MTKLTLEDYMKQSYDTIIVPDQFTDGSLCYRAEHPQLKGCMSHGQTPEEAEQNLKDAKRLYISTLLKKGLDVPLPQGITSGTFSSLSYSYIVTVVNQVEELAITNVHKQFSMPHMVESKQS